MAARLAVTATIATTIILASTTIASAAAAAKPSDKDDFERNRIRIVGSSTVFPFTATVAERFGRFTEHKPPVVERTGTGSGIKLFCEGEAEDGPDIVNASRQIKKSELSKCGENGVDNIIETLIGFDGIVLGNAVDGPEFSITTQQLYLALAANIPTKKGFQPNLYKNWQDIDESLPDAAIRVYGPPPSSGTRDAVEELVMIAQCKEFPLTATLSKEQLHKQCAAMREDGAYIEAGENDNLIIQRLVSNPASLGVFGFGFLEQNQDLVKGATINNVQPTMETIVDGRYPISRSLYLYTNAGNIDVVPGLTEFLVEFTSEDAMGDYGYLLDKGLIPLLPELLDAQRHRIQNTEVLGNSPLGANPGIELEHTSAGNKKNAPQY